MENVETVYHSDLCAKCGEMACTLNFSEALETILDTVHSCLNAGASAVHMLDPAGKLNMVAARNLPAEIQNQLTPEQEKMDKEVLGGKIVLISDLARHPDLKWLVDKAGFLSVICAPLRSRERVIGVLWVFGKETDQFKDTDAAYLGTLGGQAGVILGNARLYQNLHSLSEVGKAISSNLELQDVLLVLAVRANEIFGGKGVAIFLRSRDGNSMELTTVHGLPDYIFSDRPVPIEKTIAGCLDHLMLMSDVSSAPEARAPNLLEGEGIKAIFCAPMKVKDRSIGILRIYMDHLRDFTREDLDLLQILSDYGGISIENARLFEHIRRDYEDLTRDVWHWYDWGTRAPQI